MCQKAVYFAEEVQCEGSSFHKSCFLCSEYRPFPPSRPAARLSARCAPHRVLLMGPVNPRQGSPTHSPAPGAAWQAFCFSPDLEVSSAVGTQMIPGHQGPSELSGLTSASTHAETESVPAPGKGQAEPAGLSPDVQDCGMRQGLSKQWWQEVAHPVQCSEVMLAWVLKVALPH